MTDDQPQLKFPTAGVPITTPEPVTIKQTATAWAGPSLKAGVKPGRHLATQTQYPWRTAIRSGFGVFVLFLVAAAAASPIIGPFVNRYIPGAGAGIVAFGLFCASLTLLIKRIGTIPAVAALLVRLGVGVVPKSALK